jgi:hypothetical protein
MVTTTSPEGPLELRFFLTVYYVLQCIIIIMTYANDHAVTVSEKKV